MNLKKIRRADHCLNCNTPLSIETDNFCSNCGQLNNTKKETALGLVKELVEEFLHLDSKVMKSLVPLLFKPGLLTVDYNQGKRARYFHPVRMFLIVTVIMFIVGSFVKQQYKKEYQEKVNKYLADSVKTGIDPRSIRPDSVYSFSSESLKLERISNSKESTEKSDLIYDFDSVKIHKDTLQRYLNEGVVDPSALMDTFKVEKTLINSVLFHQIVKTQLAGQDKLIDYFKNKLPWLLFSLMPVFAFVLYLFYIRRKVFFVDHLIFAFHLHTATFLINTIQDLITCLTPLNAEILNYYIPIYYFISLKKVYGQSIPKTIFKGIGIGFFYIIFGILVLFLVAGIMFLMI